MTPQQQEYLLNCEPKAFYAWLWSKVAKKQISKDQWFKLSHWYESNSLEKSIREVFELDE